MNSNVSPVTAAIVIVLLLAVVGVAGWFFMNRSSTAPPKAGTNPGKGQGQMVDPNV